MTPGRWLKWLWEDAKAWRRGDRRIAPRGARGRIYRRKGAEGRGPGKPPNVVIARPKPRVFIAPRRVYRAAEGRWHDIDNETGRPKGPETGD